MTVALAGVAIRLGTTADLPLVSSTWLRHYRRRSAYARAVPERLYATEQRALITLILQRTPVVCAVDASAPEVVLGYLVADAVCVHWLHVKDGFRGLGLARMLAKHAQGALYYTHETDDAATLARRLGLVLEFNPYRAWEPR